MQFLYYKVVPFEVAFVRSEVFKQPPYRVIVVMWELFGDNWIFLKIIIVSYSHNRFINIVDAVTFFFPTALEVLFPTDGINLWL